MNKFFPLPMLVRRNLSFFLPAALLGAFLTLAYCTSAYAQQHDSPASARKLEANHPISLTLPAYATEYFYFSLPNARTDIPSIRLSDSSKIQIRLQNSRGASLKYTVSSSHVISFPDSLSKGERYFLKLSSRSSRNKKLKLTLYYTKKEKAEEAGDTGKTAKAKSSTKGEPKTVTTTKPKNSANSKTTAKTNSIASAKPIVSAKTKDSSAAIHSPKPHATPAPKSATTPIPKPHVTPNPTPQKSINPSTTNPSSKSNFLLSTHFLRIKAGTSLAIAEALNLQKYSSSLSYRCIFSDRISIQNGILYAKASGIAVIEITGEDVKSSCTICIQ